MGTVTLLLGIHNHQPDGNFEHVFTQGYEDCYGRLLDAVERHPGVRLALHYSGPLIEWLEKHHPDYFDRLAGLVETGQVEMMGGGFYEPMLSVLPDRDARGQLEMMADFLEGRIGVRPAGMWLAERVWEPDLARTIASAGYRFTILDDGHFLSVGMKRPLHGYYVTEKGGLPLCLFPISMELRYSIPWKPAHEAVDWLRRVANEAGDREVVVTYGDDGEKFGMWPGTKKWVWDEGWLEQFLTLLEQNADRIHTSTFSDELKRNASSGRVYLPTASYDEMGEWVLPPEAQQRLHELNDAVADKGKKVEWGPFVRGGIWQGFMAKYPEANFMHKRMCYVSNRVARAAARISGDSERGDQKLLESAVRELYRGQCNCAYWHGLFGGLYLAKLRSAVHGHLIKADVEAGTLLGAKQPLELERADLDADLSEEVILTSRSLGITVTPAQGGALLAIDDRKRAFCLTDVLTRRPEAYHEKVRQLSRPEDRQPQGAAAPLVSADTVTLKEDGLADILVYDPHQRLAFVDQFFPAEMSLEELWRCRGQDLSSFKETAYDLVQATAGTGQLMLSCTGRVRTGTSDAGVEVLLRKAFQLDEVSLQVELEIVPAGPLRSVLFATELSLALPSASSPSTRYRLFRQARGDVEQDAVTITSVSQDVSRLELSDAQGGMTVTLSPTPPATVVRFPLETVSQSESGIGRTYQGSVVVFLWRCELDAGEALRPAVKLQLS